MSHSQDDSTGSNNKAPKLINIADFPMWKFRMQQFFYLTDASLWDSVVNGPHQPTAKAADSDLIIPKDPILYTDLDKRLLERDLKSLACLTTALPNEILHGFKQHSTARDLWNALSARYEGNEELKENRKDCLRKQYETFTIQKGESVTSMMNRYTHLLSDMQSAGLTGYSEEQFNKKLLDALPNSWNMISLLIKRTSNLKTMTIEDLIGQIQSSESSMKKDDSHTTVYPYNSSSGCALISNYSQSPSYMQTYTSPSPSPTVPFLTSYSSSSPSSTSGNLTDKFPNLSSGNTKTLEENL